MTEKNTDIKAQFTDKLIVVVTDLRDEGTKDPEAMWMLGSLAANLIDSNNVKSWPEFKTALTQQAYEGLLASFKKQGNDLMEEGKAKAAYAIQTLGTSVIGDRFPEEEIVRGVAALDSLIAQTIANFRRLSAANAKSKNPTIN